MEEKLRVAVLLSAIAGLFSGHASSEPTAQLQVSSDGRFLMQQDGSPFFWLADTGWSLFQRLDREEADEYLADRAAKGYNLIQAVVFGGPIESYTTPNKYGDLPLIDGDPSRPNPKYFEHVDWVVERAAERGLRVGMLPVWGASVIGGWVADPSKQILTPKNAQAYGEWLGRRYRDKGVIWILGGDTPPLGPTRSPGEAKKRDITLTDYRPLYDAIANGLIRGDGGKPLITYHISCCSWPGAAQPRTSEYFGDRDWLSFNLLQSSHFRDPGAIKRKIGVEAMFAWNAAYNYEAVKAEYDSMPIRPVIDGEPRYEDLVVDVESDPKLIEQKGYWGAYDVRNAAYHAIFAGAAGHTYGNHSIWQFYDPKYNTPAQGARAGLPWRKALLQPGTSQMRHLKSLMLSRPYFTRIPDQSLIVGAAGEGESHIGATRDRAGSYAMAYVPKGQAVTADLRKITGLSAVAWWFDPRTGTAERVAGAFSTSQTITFVPPSTGPESDWVLVIDDESRNFNAPGSVQNGAWHAVASTAP